MTEKIQKLMNDNPVARWAVLALVALMMFFAYMFVDVMSPLKSLVEANLGWNSAVFGKYAASEYILNVCGFLILAGIILDKLGVRFSGILSAGLMVFGAAIKFVGVSDWFQTTGFAQWLGSWWVEMPASAKMASLGFMIFGCGCEMEGTNVSKILAKWFKGKEMALAMGLEMAIARLGVFGVMWIAPLISEKFGGSVVAPMGFCGALLCIGLINFIIFAVMDSKFDRQLVAAGLATDEKSPEDEFHVSDLAAIFKNTFTAVAGLVVLVILMYLLGSRSVPLFRSAEGLGNSFPKGLRITEGILVALFAGAALYFGLKTMRLYMVPPAILLALLPGTLCESQLAKRRSGYRCNYLFLRTLRAIGLVAFCPVTVPVLLYALFSRSASSSRA